MSGAVNAVFVSCLFLFSSLLAQEYPGFRVMGRHLYDPCGERVILRGVANPNIWYQRDGLPHYEEIEQTGIDLAGEAGEYHTIVTDGPLFSKPLNWQKGEVTFHAGYWFVSIQVALQ